MKAENFRIGNLVLHPKTNEIVEITRDMFAYHNALANLEDYKPIPLTKEMLLKFGFKTRTTDSHSIQYFIGENPVTRDWLFDILWLESYNCPFYRNGFFSIQHIHQLQNLYFALTNQELILKD